MTARIWTTTQLNQVIGLTAGSPELYKTITTKESRKVINIETKVEVLAALKHPSGKWLVRYDERTFA